MDATTTIIATASTAEFTMDLNSITPEVTSSENATGGATGLPGSATLRLALYVPILVLGTVGNFLSFVVMRRKSMRETSPGVYFAAIAVGDTLALYVGVVPFIVFYSSGVDLWTLHAWSCRFVMFTLFTSSDAAVWLIVAVTVDRFISVRFPLRRKALCTPRNALRVAAILPLVATAKNVHLFFTRARQVIENPDVAPEEWEVNNCGFPSDSVAYFEIYVRPWIGFTLYAYIPLAAVLVLNTLIIRTLWKVRKVGQAPEVPSGQGQGDQNHPGQNQNHQGQGQGQGQMSQQQERARKSNAQLTAMFLSISVTFLLLLPPSMTTIALKPYLDLTEAQAARYAYLESFADSLAYLMHSINFYLYCLTGPGFRRELRRVFARWCHRGGAEGETEASVTQTTHK